MRKRLISLVITISMLVSLVPVSFAEKETVNEAGFEEQPFESVHITDGELFKRVIESEDVPKDETDDEPISSEEITDDAEIIADDEVYAPEISEDIELFSNGDIQLMATGTYYSEYGIYFDASSGTITDADESISGTLNIPETIDGISVLKIGSKAFQNCAYLTGVNIPKTVTSIESSAFQNCSNLSSVKLNYNNAREFKCEIGGYVFSGCEKLTELTIPESVTYLGERFIENTGIESIIIPKSITSVGNDRAYYSVDERDGPLANCTSLTHVELEDGMTTIPAYLFASPQYSSYIENVMIPSSVTKIGEYAFRNCDSITAVNIPKNVATIEAGTFRDCSNLSNVALNYNNAREFKCEIGGYAFSGCEKLTELTIPESVTYLGERFIENTGIESITIPKSIASVGNDRAYYSVDERDGPLANCTSLTHVELEDGMTAIPAYLFASPQYSSYIENVTIPSSVTKIGEYAFRNCDSITAVNISKSVATIETGAFRDCSNLSGVTLNYNNEREFECKIYDNVFNGCEKLTELALPNSVTYLGHHLIAGTAISSITIPKSVKEVGAYYGGPFDGAIYLDNVFFADGITSIPNNICESLSYESYISRVEIPATVTSIGNNAFRNSTRLYTLNVPDSVNSIGEHAFENCPNLIINISEAAPAIADLIDGDVRFSLTKDITNFKHFNFSGTDYYSKTNEMTGYVPFEIKYSVQDKVDISDKVLTVKIPSNSELVQSTLKIDGILTTQFTEENNKLKIPLEKDNAIITFCVKPTEYTTLLSYAKMDFKENNERRTEMIGVVNCSIPNISIKADSITNSKKVIVEGIAPPESTVVFYIGDDYMGTTTAIKSGNYKSEITLNNPKDYDKYIITAQTDANNERYDAQATVMFQEDAPTLKTLNMYYGDHNGIHKYELSNQTVKPTIVYNPAYGFKFQAEFDNAENLDKVYIVSTRNNQKKYMDAEWDEATKSYIAEGRFEGTNSNYVPGEITVEYTKKRPVVPISNTINTEELIKHMDSAVKDCTTTVIENTDTSYKARINVADKLTDLLGDEINMTVETLDKEYSSVPITDLIKEGKNFYSYFIDEDSDKYVFNLDFTDPEKAVMVVHDISGSKQLSYILDFMDNSIPGKPSKALALSEILGKISTVTGTISDMYDIETSDEKLRDKIYAAGMSEEEQAIALKKADELKTDRQMFLLLTTAITAATMGAAGPPALVFGLLFGAITTSSSFFWDMRMANILGGGTGYSCKWSIDPSGYVYEAVTSNRLEGVTVTAYWIAPDYIDDDGNGDTSKSELWDASKYAQANPLLTDINGMYAWDVPEGLWQVKYEKDGYETQTSEWLPVPPPQTDVNVGLVSKAAPVVESAELTSDALTVTFNKYMKPETVADVNIGGHNYTMSYSKNETAPDGTIYAKTYVFKLNDTITDGANIAISIRNAESYAGVKMAPYSENIICSNEAKTLEPIIRIENQQEDKDNKKVSVDFTNISDNMQAFEAICAIYDGNGALIEVVSKPIIGLDANATENKYFIFDKEWSSYKMFVWNNMIEMTPVAEMG